MIPQAPEGVSMVPMLYSFLKPARLRIRDKDGKVSLIGYGIGEQIQIMEPVVQYLVASHELYKEIPLTDNQFVVEWPNDLTLKRVYETMKDENANAN